jgi:hypothetical protein
MKNCNSFVFNTAIFLSPGFSTLRLGTVLGMAKSRSRYESARHPSLFTVLWDGEKPQTLETRGDQA